MRESKPLLLQNQSQINVWVLQNKSKRRDQVSDRGGYKGTDNSEQIFIPHLKEKPLKNVFQIENIEVLATLLNILRLFTATGFIFFGGI